MTRVTVDQVEGIRKKYDTIRSYMGIDKSIDDIEINYDIPDQVQGYYKFDNSDSCSECSKPSAGFNPSYLGTEYENSTLIHEIGAHMKQDEVRREYDVSTEELLSYRPLIEGQADMFTPGEDSYHRAQLEYRNFMEKYRNGDFEPLSSVSHTVLDTPLGKFEFSYHGSEEDFEDYLSSLDVPVQDYRIKNLKKELNQVGKVLEEVENEMRDKDTNKLLEELEEIDKSESYSYSVPSSDNLTAIQDS
ncbi:MAG: hypothetical protein MUP58_03210 [Candidatus Nanohaloarchaeota archaeon QJJ-9]|nr:hypothetical protein [Candidatus Nanohaloarchaeota archaeon QJJ-9]